MTRKKEVHVLPRPLYRLGGVYLRRKGGRLPPYSVRHTPYRACPQELYGMAISITINDRCPVSGIKNYCIKYLRGE
jgi:hypothetical protein